MKAVALNSCMSILCQAPDRKLAIYRTIYRVMTIIYNQWSVIDHNNKLISAASTLPLAKNNIFTNCLHQWVFLLIPALDNEGAFRQLAL